MPAEKGIPKPEASAKRLDVRDYDSRTAWGWLSEDGQMIMSKEGVTYVDVELVRLSLRKLNLLATNWTFHFDHVEFCQHLENNSCSGTLAVPTLETYIA